MRHRIIILLILVGLMSAAAVTPASAGPPVLPEERIDLLCEFFPGAPECIETFEAGVPFWIGHGVFLDHGKGINQKGNAPAVGHYDFKLFVDGAEVTEDWTFHGGTTTFDVFIFLEGLEGSVTFVGEWYGTCTLDEVGVVEGCDKPSDPILLLTRSLTVDFIDS